MIILENLIKQYGKREILNIPFFHFEKNKTYLLIGSNGSGKSTLLKCILGINPLTKGNILINSNNIGYVPERIFSIDFLTLNDFLKVICDLYESPFNQNTVDEYYKRFELNGDIRLNIMSKGMLQKAMIIQSLIHNATLFIFDEPLNGLDKISQNVFFQILNKLKLTNKSVIVTTHYPEFYSFAFDYIIKLDNGNIKYASN
ncbi:MAG: ABC transporter ATP-binding protein [Bacilli bacterium]|nr:ABC transporter ATP-binding protein [Acholeplasmataceae bacterium]MDY2902818.1 ABC transporter ATP-binding protein [Bacilli bacterium]